MIKILYLGIPQFRRWNHSKKKMQKCVSPLRLELSADQGTDRRPLPPAPREPAAGSLLPGRGFREKVLMASDG